jgi:hypothetical protein
VAETCKERFGKEVYQDETIRRPRATAVLPRFARQLRGLGAESQGSDHGKGRNPLKRNQLRRPGRVTAR